MYAVHDLARCVRAVSGLPGDFSPIRCAVRVWKVNELPASSTTAMNRMLRRIHVLPSLKTILEAEGVVIDAVGAIVAVVTPEVILNPTGHALAVGLAGLPLRMSVGLMIGLPGGAIVAFLLRVDRIVPERLGNVFALAMAVATFQVSNALISESGLVAAIVAGLVVGNVRTRVLRELIEFKEQLTAMFIGMLFICCRPTFGSPELWPLVEGTSNAAHGSRGISAADRGELPREAKRLGRRW